MKSSVFQHSAFSVLNKSNNSRKYNQSQDPMYNSTLKMKYNAISNEISKYDHFNTLDELKSN